MQRSQNYPISMIKTKFTLDITGTKVRSSLFAVKLILFGK